MLIFVILSITEAYLSNPSQLQPQLHPCEHPRTLLCPRPPTPQHIVPPCSPPSLPPYPPPKPLFHLPLPPPIFHPFSPPRPAFCPPAPPCPPPSLPSSCPPTTAHPYPSPPAVTPPSNYELIHYSDGISESYQGSYKNHNSCLMNNTVNETDSSFFEKKTNSITSIRSVIQSVT